MPFLRERKEEMGMKGKGREHSWKALIVISLVGVILRSGTAWGTPSAPVPVSANVHVTVTVPAFVKLEVSSTAINVTLTQADIERGYVDLVGATELRLWTNSRKGATIQIRLENGVSNGLLPPLSFSYRVQGNGDFTPLNGGDQQLYKGTGIEIASSKQIDYRLNLGWDTKPGAYQFSLIYTTLLNE